MNPGISGGKGLNEAQGLNSSKGELKNYLPHGAVSFPEILSRVQALGSEEAQEGAEALMENGIIEEIVSAERKMAEYSFRQAQGQPVNVGEAAATARKLWLEVNYLATITRSLTSSLRELLNTQV